MIHCDCLLCGQSGDSLVIWAAKNGRADTLKALLDADTTGKIFQDESICFIQVCLLDPPGQTKGPDLDFEPVQEKILC